MLALLQKTINSRKEPVDIHQKKNRPELADKERFEIAVTSSYPPSQMSEAEVAEAICAAVADLGATSIKDMARWSRR